MDAKVTKGVPIVNLKGLSQAEEDLQSIASEIYSAYTTVGFVAVIDHNISNEEVAEAWEKVDEFYQLPQKTKLKYTYVSIQ